MTQDFIEGFTLPLKSYKIILTEPGLKQLAILPIVINVIVFATIISFIFYSLFQWEIPNLTWEFWGPMGSWLSEFVNGSVEAFKYIILMSVGFVLSYYSFSIIGLVLASPFNDMLSERIEKVICEKRDPSAAAPLHLNAQIMVLSTIDSARISLKQLIFTLICLPFLFVPFVGFLPFFVVSAWFTGVGYLDVGMARNNLRLKHKKLVLQENKWKIFGMGAAMELLFMVPFLNLLLLPFGVSAGTHMYCQIDWDNYFKTNNITPPTHFQAPSLKLKT